MVVVVVFVFGGGGTVNGKRGVEKREDILSVLFRRPVPEKYLDIVMSCL